MCFFKEVHKRQKKGEQRRPISRCAALCRHELLPMWSLQCCYGLACSSLSLFFFFCFVLFFASQNVSELEEEGAGER